MIKFTNSLLRSVPSVPSLSLSLSVALPFFALAAISNDTFGDDDDYDVVVYRVAASIPFSSSFFFFSVAVVNYVCCLFGSNSRAVSLSVISASAASALAD